MKKDVKKSHTKKKNLQKNKKFFKRKKYLEKKKKLPNLSTLKYTLPNNIFYKDIDRAHEKSKRS